MNFFGYQSAAERYARCRPYFHPLVVEWIKTFLQLDKPVGQALDVGCGTGHSTMALKAIATTVVGTDVSAAMLAQVQPDPQIRYLEAPAEEVPLAAASCDLITSSLAFHWFERDHFLAEAQRLLKAQGWLVIYNNGFLGQMLAQPVFERWHNEVYLVRYPSPPRQVAPLTAERAHRFGLLLAHREQYQNEVDFTVATLAAYLTTQSNVIAAVEQGSESVETIYQWLVAELSPLFPVESATFAFGGYIWYLQKEQAS